MQSSPVAKYTGVTHCLQLRTHQEPGQPHLNTVGRNMAALEEEAQVEMEEGTVDMHEVVL